MSGDGLASHLLCGGIGYLHMTGHFCPLTTGTALKLHDVQCVRWPTDIVCDVKGNNKWVYIALSSVMGNLGFGKLILIHLHL